MALEGEAFGTQLGHESRALMKEIGVLDQKKKKKKKDKTQVSFLTSWEKTLTQSNMLLY
jgi:hypothetical protein